jgi:hypothetical protein
LFHLHAEVYLRGVFSLQKFLTENWTSLAALGTVITAAVGWLLTYLGWSEAHKNNLDLEKRKLGANLRLEEQKFRISLNLDKKRAELKFVSEQIQFLYGPLFSLESASEIAFLAFMELHAPNRDAFFDGKKRSKSDLEAWRMWMSEVMMPINLRMEQAIIENSHLIIGSSMPKSFQVFLGHVSSYKAVLKKWEEAKSNGALDQLTDSDHVAVANFPSDMKNDVRTAFVQLHAKQLELLSITEAITNNSTELTIF